MMARSSILFIAIMLSATHSVASIPPLGSPNVSALSGLATQIPEKTSNHPAGWLRERQFAQGQYQASLRQARASADAFADLCRKNASSQTRKRQSGRLTKQLPGSWFDCNTGDAVIRVSVAGQLTTTWFQRWEVSSASLENDGVLRRHDFENHIIEIVGRGNRFFLNINPGTGAVSVLLAELDGEDLTKEFFDYCKGGRSPLAVAETLVSEQPGPWIRFIRFVELGV